MNILKPRKPTDKYDKATFKAMVDFGLLFDEIKEIAHHNARTYLPTYDYLPDVVYENNPGHIVITIRLNTYRPEKEYANILYFKCWSTRKGTPVRVIRSNEDFHLLPQTLVSEVAKFQKIVIKELTGGLR